ncbi:hypothetical protein [Cytobacillus gottheilii]|uniref:Uncharacterized protein n=1 Tax=Cytobacillus gottheilii TaxID=859144 RepID=A0ABX8FEL6_9BACI|nr:hypothetical protein [Cytobacillus gottheilii]QVY62464.1 hypothetical protein J1899_05125 [Cytobacillus gottheilii]
MNNKQSAHDHHAHHDESPAVQESKRFKVHSNKRKQSYKEGGIIHRIGTDYVDLLQSDHSVVRVLTRRIKKIHWVDHHCRNKCLDHVDFEKACRGNDLHCSHCSRYHRDCRCGMKHKNYSDFDKISRDYDRHDGHCTHCGRHQQDCHCGMGAREKFIDSYLDSHCAHCRRDHDNCHCGKQFHRIKDPVIPYCDDRIHLRLAGLTDSFQYKLFKHKGCKVVLELDLSDHFD